MVQCTKPNVTTLCGECCVFVLQKSDFTQMPLCQYEFIQKIDELIIHVVKWWIHIIIGWAYIVMASNDGFLHTYKVNSNSWCCRPSNSHKYKVNLHNRCSRMVNSHKYKMNLHKHSFSVWTHSTLLMKSQLRFLRILIHILIY